MLLPIVGEMPFHDFSQKLIVTCKKIDETGFFNQLVIDVFSQTLKIPSLSQ